MLLWAAFGDDWALGHLVTFDGANRRIIVAPTADSIDVKIDLYSSWKEWMRLYDNSKYLPAFRVIGGDPVGGGQYAGDIYFLINGWQIVVDHTIKVTGTLYHDDPLDPFIILPGGGVTATVSNLAYAYSQTATSGAEPDWTDEEKRQIRYRLGLDGTQSTPTASGTLPQVAATVATLPTTLTALSDAVSQVPGAVWDEQVVDHMSSGSAGEALGQVSANVQNMTITTVSTMSMVQNLWKYERNRTKIDTNTKQLIIYDTDGVTPIQIYNLRDRNGQPSVVESMERIPTM